MLDFRSTVADEALPAQTMRCSPEPMLARRPLELGSASEALATTCRVLAARRRPWPRTPPATMSTGENLPARESPKALGDGSVA